jgi:hypothetical protein
MRVIWRLITAVLAVVFIAGLFTSLAGKRKAGHRAGALVTAKEIEPERWGAFLAPSASRSVESGRSRRRGKRRRAARRRRTRA